jgi:hypothetical protein
MKNKNLGMLGMVLCVAMLGEAQTEKPRIERTEKIRQEIASAENDLTEAPFKPDRDALDRLWSDEFVFTNPAGKVSHKAQRLAAIKPGTPSVIESSHSDKVDVYPYNERAAVATILSTWKTKRGNDEVVEQYQGTHFWVKERGRWRLVAAHVSVVAQ